MLGPNPTVVTKVSWECLRAGKFYLALFGPQLLSSENVMVSVFSFTLEVPTLGRQK